MAFPPGAAQRLEFGAREGRPPLGVVSALSVLAHDLVEPFDDGLAETVGGLPARPDLRACLVVLAGIGELEEPDPDVVSFAIEDPPEDGRLRLEFGTGLFLAGDQA